MPRNCAVIYQAHQWNAVHALRYERLRREVGELADCFILFHASADDPQLRSTVAVYPEARFFETEALQRALGYPYFTDKGVLPGSTHFPIVEFSRGQHYDQYWFVESDVEFSGNWGDLIRRVPSTASAHFVACHIKPYAEMPRNMWWRELTVPAGVPVQTADDDWRMFAFLPIARFSALALRTVDQAHQQGWNGFLEVLIPSVLRQAGLEMADFNQFGSLYQPSERRTRVPGERGNSYSGSMRWRPAICLNEFARHLAPDTLYHPIKEAWTYGPEGVKREHRGRLKTVSVEQLRSARWA